MPYKTLEVWLYRCNACYAVHAFSVWRPVSAAPYKLCGPSHSCKCGENVWTRIKVVN